MVRKNTTIDGLAVMINAGFGAVDKRLDAMDRRLDAMDNRLSNIGREISEIHKHLVYRDEFDDLMDRVKYLELKLGIESGKQKLCCQNDVTIFGNCNRVFEVGASGTVASLDSVTVG